MNFDRRAVSAPTREVAAWISGLRYEDLPQRTREVVRSALLDTLGCGVYGFNTSWAGLLLEWARAGGTGGECTVWGEAQPSLRAADAALVNGTASHAFELDDYHNAKLHPGAVVVPAAVALADGNPEVEVIACFTRSGRTARLIATERPAARIIAFSPDPAVRRRLALVYGVEPRPIDDVPGSDVSATLAEAVASLEVSPGAGIVLVATTAGGRDGPNLIELSRRAS